MLRPLVNSVAGQVRAALAAGRDAVFGAVTGASFTGPLVGNADTADLADDPEILFPSYRRLVSALGYTALDALYRMQEPSGDVKSRGNAADPVLTQVTSPVYGYMVNGFQGIHFDSDGDAFSADVLDIGANSVHMAAAFYRATGGVNQVICGRYAADRNLFLYVDTADLAKIQINDGTRSSGTSVSATTLPAGGIYLLQAHLRKDDGTLKTRLSRWGVGLVSAEQSVDVSAYTTLAGGTTPLFGVGRGFAWGTGTTALGCMVRIGTEVQVAGRMAALASRVGFE